MILSASTTSSGILQELMRLGTTGVTVNKKLFAVDDIYTKTLKVATESFVSTSISAIPLSNYTPLSTFNSRVATVDNRFSPIESRQALLKALSNKDTIDLSSGDVVNILPISKLDTSTLQTLITSANASQIKTTLGLSPSATSGTIEYANILNKPTFGALSLKNSVDLSTSDSIGNLDFARISNTPSYVLTSNFDSRITPIETKLTGFDSSITSKLLTLNLGTGSQPSGIVINAPSSAVNGNAVINMNNASSSCNWGLYHSGQNGTAGLLNGSLGFYNFTLSSHILQLRPEGSVIITTTTDSASATSGALTVAGGVSIAKKLYVGNDLIIGGSSLSTNITTNSYLYVKGNSNPWTTTLSTPGLFMVYDTSQNFGVIQSIVKSTNISYPLRLEASYVHIPGTNDSTGVDSGAFLVSGGASVAKKLVIGTILDTGVSATSQHTIQTSSASDVLKIKNRANNGYASILFESGSNVQASIGVGGSTVSNPTTNRLYLKSPSIYLDAQDISYPGVLVLQQNEAFRCSRDV
ncbi:hypothetical protein DFS34DRAFT_650996 [Phlyctochytrium arcticum]|nr:hypothetical protein DFS34DRAFT_650996 [Phlyctochytrium arcticum]